MRKFWKFHSQDQHEPLDVQTKKSFFFFFSGWEKFLHILLGKIHKFNANKISAVLCSKINYSFKGIYEFESLTFYKKCNVTFRFVNVTFVFYPKKVQVHSGAEVIIALTPPYIFNMQSFLSQSMSKIIPFITCIVLILNEMDQKEVVLTF